VHLVAEHGWRFMPDYRFDPATGLWRHKAGAVEPPVRLHQISYGPDGEMRFPARHDRAPESALDGYLAEARRLVAQSADAPPDADLGGRISAGFEHLRWFELPAVCLG